MSYDDENFSKKNELIQRRRKYFAGSYLFYKNPVNFVRGKGIWLYDEKGEQYLDCYNNVASVGHCHPKVVEAISRQAATLNTHTRYLNKQIINYSEKLASTMPSGLDICFYTCTGTEANELAMRIARCVTGNHGATVLDHAYHGNSTLIGELSTMLCPPSERPDYVATIEPPNTYRGSYRRATGIEDTDLAQGYAQQADSAIQELTDAGHGVAAFMCDAIFDSQGTLDAPPDYFKLVYEKIHAAGGLCIGDEVQPGFGRLGDHMWGFEHYGVMPDIVTLGKPMGGGHPIAGVVTSREIADKFMQSVFYFNTYGGNPVAAAAADAVLTVIKEEGLQQNARDVGAYLQERLEQLANQHPIIGDIRGKGLFKGVELVRDWETLEPAADEAYAIVEFMKDEGVLISSTGRFGNVLKIRPPLVFSTENTDLLVEKLAGVLTDLNTKMRQ